MRHIFSVIALVVLALTVACSSGTSSKTSTPGANACGGAAPTESAGGCGGAEATAAAPRPTSSASQQLNAASFAGIAQDGLKLGNADAPVTINLYQSFLCPHCRDFAFNMLPQLIADYVVPGKALIVFHDAAFGGGAADVAHEAAHCAADQGKFWPAYLVLYQNFSDDPTAYTKPHLESLLATTAVDGTKLAACLDTDEHQAEVDASTVAFQHLADRDPIYQNALATIEAGQGPAIPMLDIGGTYLTAPEDYATVKVAVNAKLSQ